MKHAFIGSREWHASWPKISIDSEQLTVVYDQSYTNGEAWEVKPGTDEDKREIFLWMEETK